MKGEENALMKAVTEMKTLKERRFARKISRQRVGSKIRKNQTQKIRLRQTSSGWEFNFKMEPK